MLTQVISQSFPAALSFACTTVEPCMETMLSYYSYVGTLPPYDCWVQQNMSS